MSKSNRLAIGMVAAATLLAVVGLLNDDSRRLLDAGALLFGVALGVVLLKVLLLRNSTATHRRVRDGDALWAAFATMVDGTGLGVDVAGLGLRPGPQGILSIDHEQLHWGLSSTTRRRTGWDDLHLALADIRLFKAEPFRVWGFGEAIRLRFEIDGRPVEFTAVGQFGDVGALDVFSHDVGDGAAT